MWILTPFLCIWTYTFWLLNLDQIVIPEDIPVRRKRRFSPIVTIPAAGSLGHGRVAVELSFYWPRRLQRCFCRSGHAPQSVPFSEHQWPEADDELFQAGLCQETNGGITARHQKLPLTVSWVYKHRLVELWQCKIPSRVFVHRNGGSVVRYSKNGFNLALIFHHIRH